MGVVLATSAAFLIRKRSVDDSVKDPFIDNNG
jgi:hypothetical protein